MESWATRHRRGLRGSACAVLVLVVVGFSVRAPVMDWWLSREACGGELPGGDLETVRPDTRLGTERESFDEDRGEYHCVLETDHGKVVVAVDAYLDEADREEELSFAGRSYPPHAVLPGGLPGFEAQDSLVYLMPECPSGGPEPHGERRRLLVGTWTYFAESREEKAAMLRLAVRMTNAVSEKLGCGGEPLPEPEDGAVPDTGTYVLRAEAEGTACGALATTRVPAEGRDGVVRIAVADGGVVGRCTLRAPGETGGHADRNDGADLGRPLVELTSWRGDWGTKAREMGSGPDPLPMGDGTWKPALTEHRAWAVARCDGENAGFAAHWGYDYPYRERGEEGKYEPPTEAELKERRALLREYVAAFAEDQVRRGNCTELQLPANP
ncbi:hypothetical protein QCN29_20510 [Streptomyces sp. HNM0663]|uniref:Uncharacterized protein n=1 Tax=Streptomyces chengmaiensis TaxID=3040919 RepID=A0ABT6HR95_9ACTN|nr:hypothetical protein [Streptomyces chengmaiensis]MDH2391130.1 hypothetical protein [Streptomyces chengmaiensis]